MLRVGERVILMEDHYQCVTQYQMVSPESMHTSNTIWTEQVEFRNIYVHMYTYMYETAINEKEAMSLIKSKEGYMGWFEV